MKNKEKAIELFNSEVGNLDVPDFDRKFEILTAIEAMAEWKDQIFKEEKKQLLKNISDWINNHAYDNNYWGRDDEGGFLCVDELVDDLCKYMEEFI